MAAAPIGNWEGLGGVRPLLTTMSEAFRQPDGLFESPGQTNPTALEQRQLMEDALRASEERLRATIEYTPNVGVQWYDLDGRVLYWNRASEQIFGYPAGDALGRTLDQLIFAPEATATFHNILRQIHSNGRPAGPLEFAFRRRDGTTGTCLSTVFGIPGRQGQASFVCMDVDITERKCAEAELRASEAQFRTIIESSPVAMLVGNTDQQILYANPKFTRLFGYTLADVPNVDAWWPLAYPDPQYRLRIQSEWGERVLEAARQSGPLRPMEAVVRCRDGSQRTIEFTTSAYADRVLIVFSDLTDRVRLEQELRQAQKMEVVGRLAGGVAHDINNMLQAITGFATLAGDSATPADQRQTCLTEVLAAAGRAAEITRQLLAFGRRQPLHMVETDLNELVGNLLKLLRRLLGEDIELQFTPGPSLACVRCDRTQIEQVLMNLCVNARDAMPNGGRIGITLANHPPGAPAARPGSEVRLRVTDTGCGIDGATLDRIFEPFFTTKPMEKGTGLGLSVVYGIINQHLGHIAVESSVGIGSTFIIGLPAVEPNSQPAPPAGRQRARGGTETILVAEDEAVVRRLMQRILRQAGYRVLLASHGAEALEIFRRQEQEIDLLLLDAVMPELGGLETYDRIRQQRPDIPVLLCSGYSEELATRGAASAPRVPLLPKPFDPDQLLHQVRTVLNQPRNADRGSTPTPGSPGAPTEPSLATRL